MKTVYYIILCVCLSSCHFQTKNKKMKSDLNVSLIFYASMSSIDPIYSIDIINDSIIIETNHSWGNNKKYRGKLTNNQCAEIQGMISALTEKYDRSNYFVKGGWGCTLKVDNQIYYKDNCFSFLPPSNEIGEQATPEEIKLLIECIVSLSPIQIEFYWF